MNPQMEELLKKYAKYLSDYTSDTAIRNGALFIDNTLKENEGSSIPEETLCRIASDVNRNIHYSNSLIGIQACQEKVDDDGKVITLGYALRFCGETKNEDGMDEVGLEIKQYKKELKTEPLKVKMLPKDSPQIKEINALHEIDAEKELEDLVCWEIASELTQRCNASVKSVIKNETDWSYSGVGDKSERWKKEVFRTLYTTMLNASEKIARDTRQGPGNVYFVSPKACVALQSLKEFEPAKIDENVIMGVLFGEIGQIHGTKIIRDTFAYVDSGKDTVIIGYKGSRESEAGVMLLLHSIIIGDDNRISIKYALITEGAEDYYHRINVDFNMEEDKENEDE